jgi:hypothetical protein
MVRSAGNARAPEALEGRTLVTRAAPATLSLADPASLAALFGGIALMQLSDAAEHISDKTLPADLWLALVSGALVLVVFGGQLGRLAMRLEMQRLRAAPDKQSNETPG